MEQINHKLIIAEYSEYPGPRYSAQGDSSGEDFYHERLNEGFAEALLSESNLVVNLDGTAGYASSFLDEAFGNLVYDFTEQIVKTNLEIISNQEPDWKEMIINDVFVDWEKRRIAGQEPKKTKDHGEWFRLENGKPTKKKWL